MWLDPSLRVRYWPRSEWQALGRQFLATGIWRGELVRRLHGRHPPRFFAPPVLVLVSGAAVVLVPLAAVGALPAWLGYTALVGPSAYAALLAGVAVGTRGTPLERLRRSGVLAVMHYAWGSGFLAGMARAPATPSTRHGRRHRSPERPPQARHDGRERCCAPFIDSLHMDLTRVRCV